jgi:predicted transglutaminase-like cysteine proteinase
LGYRLLLLLAALGLDAAETWGASLLAPSTAGLYADQSTVAEPRLRLPQWDRVLAALQEEGTRYETCASGGECSSERVQRWLRLLQALQGQDRARQLVAVNAFINELPYRSDFDTYGLRDRWASPLEFLARSGDCEDYAIAKYVSLRRLGVPRQELRLAVVEDTVRQTQHAVLLAWGDEGWQILDNLAAGPVPLAASRRYVPYYSFDEAMRWTHALLATVPARREDNRPTPAGEPRRD